MELRTTKCRILFCLACGACNTTSTKRGQTTDFTSLIPSCPKPPPPREDERLILLALFHHVLNLYQEWMKTTLMKTTY